MTDSNCNFLDCKYRAIVYFEFLKKFAIQIKKLIYFYFKYGAEVFLRYFECFFIT